MEVITTHVNADFDAFASMVAAKKLYPNAVLAFAGSQEKSLRDFFLSSALYAFKCEKLRDIDLKKVTRVILVDIRQKNRIGKFASIVDKPGVDLHIYDHHPPAKDDLHGSLEVVREVGATVTILCQVLKKKKIALLPDEATIMMLGIYEDTGSLTFPSTRKDDYRAAAYLLSKGADLNLISDILIKEFTAEQISLLNEMVESAATVTINGVDVVVAKVSSATYVSDFAVLVHKLREMEHIDVLFVLARMEDRVYLVGRSRRREIDVGEIAKEFGGGGHSSAASAAIRDLTLFQVEERLKSILQRTIDPPRIARDFMSFPVKTVDAAETLNEAGNILTRYNINVLPVLKRGRLLGLISRQVIEKASHHGLKELPVEEYMIRDFSEVHPETPWPTIQEIIIESNQRFLPVTEKRKLIGGITRTDLLRVLHTDLSEEPHYLFEQGASSSLRQKKIMLRQMEEQLPKKLLHMLRDLGSIAEGMGVNAYIVGGFARDIFLRRNNFDIDVVIEGDGIAFARKVIAKDKKARVKIHKTFGTAVIIFPDGFKVDVASARLEYYAHPAALPQVEMSSIKLDLYRRDFTINTLAIRLNPPFFGELIDFFGARKDIKQKTIRVIHNLSFVEDPTRILRAIRFEQRFGFHIGKLTQSLIENAVKFNFLERLDGRRLLSELILILQEDEVILSLVRMRELNIVQFIHPKFTFDDSKRALCETIRDVISWYELSFLEDTYERWKIYFLALLEGLNKSEMVNLCKRLSMPEKEQKEMLHNREQTKNVLSKMVKQKSLKNSELYHLFNSLSTECLIYLMAKVTKREAKKALSTFLTQLRHATVETTGEDLKKLGFPPGKIYKKILDTLLDAKLDGKVQNRQEEIAYVKENFLAADHFHRD
jgi:tRNA nucleotidyltransferase (CCA-adding enzyme)